MKNYKIYQCIIFIIATLAIVGGIVTKLTGNIYFYLVAGSYLKFTLVVLLYAIALSLVEISIGGGKEGKK